MSFTDDRNGGKMDRNTSHAEIRLEDLEGGAGESIETEADFGQIDDFDPSAPSQQQLGWMDDVTPPVEGLVGEMAAVAADHQAQERTARLDELREKFESSVFGAGILLVLGVAFGLAQSIWGWMQGVPKRVAHWIYGHLGAFPYGDHLLDRKTRQEITTGVQMLVGAALVAWLAWSFFWWVNFQKLRYGGYLACALGFVFGWFVLKLDAGIAFQEQIEGRKLKSWRQRLAVPARLGLITISAVVVALPIEVMSLDTEIQAAMDRKSADLVAGARQKGYDNADADYSAALERYNHSAKSKAEAIEQQVIGYQSTREKLRREMIAGHAAEIDRLEAERQKVDADAVLEAGGQRISGGRRGRGPKTATLEEASKRITAQLEQMRKDQSVEIKVFDAQSSTQIAGMRAGRVTPEQREAQATQLRKDRDIERERVANLTIEQLEAEFGGELSVPDGFSDRVAILHDLMDQSWAMWFIAWLIRLAVVFFELLALIRVKFLVSGGYRAYFNPLVHASDKDCPEWVIKMCENRGLLGLSFKRILFYPEHVREAMNTLDLSRKALADALIGFDNYLRELSKSDASTGICRPIEDIQSDVERYWQNSVIPMLTQLRSGEREFQFGMGMTEKGMQSDPLPLPIWEVDRYGIEQPSHSIQLEDRFNQDRLKQFGWLDPMTNSYYKAGVAARRSYLQVIESWHQAMDEMARFIFGVVRESDDLEEIETCIRQKRMWIMQRQADLVTRRGFLERKMHLAGISIPEWPEFSDPFESLVKELHEVNREHLERLGVGWFQSQMADLAIGIS